MQLLNEILNTLPDGEVRDVRLGLHWTVVVVEMGGVLRCGLSATLFAPHGHDQGPDIPGAGQLELLLRAGVGGDGAQPASHPGQRGRGGDQRPVAATFAAMV